MRRMASYLLNKAAVAKARSLIDARQYVLDSDWGEAQPRAEAQNSYLESHSWEEYAEWHLGLTEGATDQTKARYAFVYGDFRRLHRTGLIACVYRASEWRHKDIEARGPRPAAVPRQEDGVGADRQSLTGYGRSMKSRKRSCSSEGTAGIGPADCMSPTPAANTTSERNAASSGSNPQSSKACRTARSTRRSLRSTLARVVFVDERP